MQSIKQWREIAKQVQEAYVEQILNTPTVNSRFDNINLEAFKVRLAGLADVEVQNRMIKFKISGDIDRTDDNSILLKTMKENRLQMIALRAYLYSLYEATMSGTDSMLYHYSTSEHTSFELAYSFHYRINVDGHDAEQFDVKDTPAWKILQLMQDVVITKESYLNAIRSHNSKMTEVENYIKTRSWNGQNSESQGLKNLFQQAPEGGGTEDQLEALQKAIINGLTARTYGFEVEVPDAKDVTAPGGIEKGTDGSLRSYEGNEECDCCCNECTYHECDCEWCENGNSDPEHCGDSDCATADSAEYRTIGGVQRVVHDGLHKLCHELNEVNAEKNDSAGTHIHVYAADLTTQQVGQVLAIYSWTANIMAVVAGRRNVNYAMDIPTSYIGKALKKRGATLTSDKPRAINMTNLFNGRGTLEFRQMDCNLNAERITAWAWLVRGMVTVAKRGATLKDFKHIQTLDDIIAVYARFNVTPTNEHPEQIIYGSKSDENKFVVTQHLR